MPGSSASRSVVVRRRLVVGLLAAAVVAAAAVFLVLRSTEPALAFTGPAEGELLNAEELEDLAFRVEDEGGADLEAAEVRLDGEDVSDEARVEGDTLRYAPDGLDDGEHEVEIVVPASFSREQREDWTFAVDATPPELEVTEPADGVLIAAEGLTLAGQTESGAEVRVADAEAAVDDDGAFTAELDEAPNGPVELVAVDAAGNEARTETDLVVVPSRVHVENMRGVHVTAHAWATPSFRQRVMRMVEDGLINTVALTLKDEGGVVGWDSDVELADASGASRDIYDLEETVAFLHEHDVQITGRIVAFRDPVLGEHARETGNTDWLIQTTGGEPYTGNYGCCFLSFANEEVREYNLALAEEAAAAGVDAILWDYIRRPDGSPDKMVVPGLPEDAGGGALEQGVADFAAVADERLEPYGVQHGASLYGIAADRPTQIAQDVPAMSEHLDFVSPMIYPSHWGPGEYGVDDPNRQPYDIITATLEVWKEQVEGTDTRIAPWLEDTNYRAWDRAQQVREQIRATRDHDIHEFLMWDPSVDYTVEAYEAPE